MQLITVKKFGLGQLQASAGAGVARVSRNNALSFEKNAILAAKKLCQKFNWGPFDMVWTTDKTGAVYYFVGIERENLVHIGPRFRIEAKTWFDKVNGNTYFAARVFDAVSGELLFALPFQYGYGDQHTFECFEECKRRGLIPADTDNYGFNQYVLSDRKTTDCKYREVKQFGEEA